MVSILSYSWEFILIHDLWYHISQLSQQTASRDLQVTPSSHMPHGYMNGWGPGLLSTSPLNKKTISVRALWCCGTSYLYSLWLFVKYPVFVHRMWLVKMVNKLGLIVRFWLGCSVEAIRGHLRSERAVIKPEQQSDQWDSLGNLYGNVALIGRRGCHFDSDYSWTDEPPEWVQDMFGSWPGRCPAVCTQVPLVLSVCFPVWWQCGRRYSTWGSIFQDGGGQNGGGAGGAKFNKTFSCFNIHNKSKVRCSP